MKILVVDNEAGILRFISRVLQNRGHTVLAEATVRGAVEWLARDRIDLLISDVVMPTMRGPELAAIARRFQPGLSVLLMSGSERPAGYPFLAKPLQPQSILTAVDQALAGTGGDGDTPGGAAAK